MVPPVRTLRKARGETLNDLARRADIDAGHLSRIERGLTSPSIAVAARLARALDLKDLERLLRPWDTHSQLLPRGQAKRSDGARRSAEPGGGAST